MDKRDPDNIIIAAALAEKKENPNKKVIIVSLDINLRVRCDALGIDCEGYDENQVVKREENIYTGFTKHLVDDQTIDQFYQSEKIFIEEEEKKLLPNEFVMLVSSSNDKKTALSRFISYNKPLARVDEYKHGIWDVKPRNKDITAYIKKRKIYSSGLREIDTNDLWIKIHVLLNENPFALS